MRAKILVSALVAAASFGCAVKLNGKSYGPGTSSPAGGSSGSSAGAGAGAGRARSSSDDQARAAAEEAERQAYAKKKEPEAYPDAPADPWAAVTGDQPITINDDDQHYFRVKDDSFACTAAHDHCLPRRTWLVIQDGDARTTSRAALHAIDPEGKLILPVFTRGAGGSYSESYTAYRTVPATRKNLVTGAQLFVLTFPALHPDSAMDAFNRSWVTGAVERIDWDMGFVYLRGQDKPFWIASARIGVLTWRPGGKVTIVGSAAKGSLAVDRADVILPSP